MKINIKNWNMEDQSSQIELPDFMFNSPVRADIIAEVIRWQLAKKRSGNASTKTRSDVSGTTKKPWAQKETGKSRQGSLKGPHFRGGGVVFGPHPRSYEYKLNKKIKTAGLFSALSDRFMDGNLLVLDSFENSFTRTKEYSEWKSRFGFNSVLFVGDINSISFRNIINFNQLDVEGINVLSLIKHEKIIFDVNSIQYLSSRYDDSSSFFLDDNDQLNQIEEVANV